MTTTPHLQLDPGERQLWTGAPRQGIVFRATDLARVPFTFVWLVAIGLGGWVFIKSGAPYYALLYKVGFALVAIYALGGRYFYDAWRRSRISYVITTERVIIKGGTLTNNTTSISLKTIIDITLQERGDGSGTIIFGLLPPLAAVFVSPPTNSGWQATPILELVPDAQGVYDIVRRAQQDVAATALAAAK